MMDTADAVARAVERWPPIVALPLRDLHAVNEPARLRLWAACDLVEMLARLMVVLGIAELTAVGDRRLPPDLLRELFGLIDEPTLGAWQRMAESVAQRVAGLSAPVFPELPGLVDRLGHRLRGDVAREDQHEENALLAVRNAFAHGGGVAEKRAAALLELWQPALDDLVATAGWLAEIELVVRRADLAVARISGADCIASPVTPAPAEMPPKPGATAVRRAERLLVLDPLVVFDVPRLGAEGEPPENEPAVQAYARRGPARLLFTPFGSEIVMQSLGAEELTDVFEKLFDFDALRREAGRRDWVRGFDEDIARDSRRMVGRAEESERLWEAASGTGEGALWVGGPAGIGKSVVMARLAQLLGEEAKERERRADEQKWLVLPYRFRAGDDRCRCDVFLKFLLERLEGWPGLAGETAEAAKERQGKSQLQQIGLLLARVSPNRVILLADGLDEIDRIDASLVDVVLPQFRGAGVLPICAGRPEPRLLALRDRLRAQEPLPDGVPKMTTGDIRAQLLARIERAAGRLIRQDRDAADGKVVNRFVDQVAANADGLPIYVDLVVNDILAQRLRLLDVVDARQLPKSLAEYFEELIERHGLDDLTTVRALVAATLTIAREPLSPEVLAPLVRRQGFALDQATGEVKVEAALASLGALVLPAETPEKAKGYRLYHDSLRAHLELSPRFSDTLNTMRGALLKGAAKPAGDAAAPYLYRNGVRHLLAAGMAEEARALLADFDYLMDRLMALAAADPAPADAITEDWLAVVQAAGRGDGEARRTEAFWRERAHMFRRGNADWPSYKILLQGAVEHGDDSPLSRKADAWLAASRCTWPWLRRLARPAVAPESALLNVLEGHTGSVEGALLLRDGRIISWSWDNTLRLWDGTTGIPGPALSGHTGRVSGALVLPDGRLLSWSEDKTLRLWDASTGAPGQVLEGHTDWVTHALVIPDGRILSWSTESSDPDERYSTDHMLRLWDPITGIPGPVVQGHTDGITGALATPDGRIFSWSLDGTCRCWEVTTGASEVAFEGHVAASDGRRFLYRDRRLQTLNFWDAVSGRRSPPLTDPELVGCLRGALLLSDRRILCWSDAPETRSPVLWFWDTLTGSVGTRLRGHGEYYIRGALETPDGRILSWAGDCTLRLWDLATGEPVSVLVGHTAPVEHALVMPDGAIISWAHPTGYLSDKSLRLWDSTTGATRSVLQGHTGEIRGALILDDHRVLSWSSDETMRLWDTRIEHTAQHAVAGHADPVAGVIAMPDQRLLSWSGKGSWVYDHTLRLWDGITGASDAILEGHTGAVEGGLVFRDGRILSWSRDRTLRIWDSAAAKPVRVLEGHENECGERCRCRMVASCRGRATRRCDFGT